MFIQLVAASMCVWALYTPALLGRFANAALRARTVGIHAACAVEAVPEGRTQPNPAAA